MSHATQLGQLEPPAWWPAGVPYFGPDEPIPPGEVPLIVSEDECERRELAAYERGRSDEGRNTVKVAAISTAVSVLVAGAIGWSLGR